MTKWEYDCMTAEIMSLRDENEKLKNTLGEIAKQLLNIIGDIK